MKKIILVFSALTVLLSCSCSFKRSLGVINDQIVLRDCYGGTSFEVSLGGKVDAEYSDSKDTYSDYAWMRENAEYNASLTLGLGVYQALYKNDYISLNTGIRFSNTARLTMYEHADHGKRFSYDYYVRSLDFHVYYMDRQEVSVVFPDIEIELPFAEGLKFKVQADLLRLSLHYEDAYFYYNFDEENNTVDGNYNVNHYYKFRLPRPYYSTLSSTYVDLGGFKLGIVYYFK